MIAYLKGNVLAIRENSFVLDVNGVGYLIESDLQTLSRLQTYENPLAIHTHMVVKEDSQALYGFLDFEAVQVFQTLTKVSGVGPKLALNILSHFTLGELKECIHVQDVKWMCQIKGVGKKVAERLLVELKHCEEKLPQAEKSTSSRYNHDQAMDALLKLGYKSQAVSKALSSLKVDEPLSVEELIRRALPVLSQI